jgi:alkyl hydroperoxide reductase subunit AhpC
MRHSRRHCTDFEAQTLDPIHFYDWADSWVVLFSHRTSTPSAPPSSDTWPNQPEFDARNTKSSASRSTRSTNLRLDLDIEETQGTALTTIIGDSDWRLKLYGMLPAASPATR